MANAPELLTTILLAEAAQGPLPAALGNFLLPAALFGVFYFLVIRPARRQELAARERISKMQPGEMVELKSGLLGKYMGTKEDGTFEVELGDRLKVRVVPDGVKGPFAPPAAAAAKADKNTPATK